MEWDHDRWNVWEKGRSIQLRSTFCWFSYNFVAVLTVVRINKVNKKETCLANVCTFMLFISYICRFCWCRFWWSYFYTYGYIQFWNLFLFWLTIQFFYEQFSWYLMSNTVLERSRCPLLFVWLLSWGWTSTALFWIRLQIRFNSKIFEVIRFDLEDSKGFEYVNT